MKLSLLATCSALAWALGTSASAGTLLLQNTTASAEISVNRPDCLLDCQLIQTAPLLSRVAANDQFSETDVMSGAMRRLARTPDAALAIQGSGSASGGILLTFLNSGIDNILLPPGAFSLAIDVRFDFNFVDTSPNFLSVVSGGAFSTLVLPPQPGAGEVQVAAVSLTQFYTQANPDDPDPGATAEGLSLTSDVIGDMTFEVLASREDRFWAVIRSGPLVLVPGAQLTVNFGHGSGALRFDVPGTFGIVDSTNTAQAALRLPQEVTLNTTVPLAWVSVVPEPSSGALMALGIAGLIAAGRRRNRANTHN